jgi:hypothetical protein
MRAWLHAVEAEAHAAAGNHSTALRSMDAAAGLLPRESNDPKMPYLALNLVHLTRWRGSVLAKLGDNDAIDALSQSLEGMGNGTFTRGDTAEARIHVEQARKLVDVVGSARQRRRVDQFAQQLTQQL